MTLAHELAEDKNNGRQTDMIIPDFSKAFDRVSHLRLLAKLHHNGIRGSIYNWIKAFLYNRNQQVIVRDGASSDKVPVVSGVLLLFLMFINELPESVISNTRLISGCQVTTRLSPTTGRPEGTGYMGRDLGYAVSP